MNEQLIRTFKEKLRRGQFVFGPFMKTCDPAFAEAAGYAGMDFAILDMEHGPVSIQGMQNNIRAAQLAGILPVVRVPAITEDAIGKALDIGAAAVEIPQITCASQAKKAVQIAKFHPQGQRGVCRFVRAAHYSAQNKEEYFSISNEILVIAQLEGTDAIANIEEILAVPGIDIVFIGPYDLSQSLGVPGQVSSPVVLDAMKKIIEKARQRDIVVGTFTDSYESMERWMKAGVQYISYSVDVGIFYEACVCLVQRFDQTLKAINQIDSKENRVQPAS